MGPNEHEQVPLAEQCTGETRHAVGKRVAGHRRAALVAVR
jgi:hypothetical protein